MTTSNVAPTPHLRRVGGVVTILALVAIACATLFPVSGEEPVGSHLCLVCGTEGGVDVVLNILLFIPLGVGLALLGVPPTRAILLMFALSTLIESAQLTVIPGRDATLGDVLTNTFGGALGFIASLKARIWLRPPPRHAIAYLTAWGAVWLGIQVISSVAFTPSIPTLDYYGQLAPVLGHFAHFRGQVFAARIGDLAIPNTNIPDGRGLRNELLGGATNIVVVEPAPPSNGVAPVLRIVDVEGREMVLLAQRNVDLIFGIRTAAAALKLRGSQFAMSPIFPPRPLPGTSGDTVVLSGRYSPRNATLMVQSSRETKRVVIPITVSLGWTLVFPSQWYIRGTRTELILSWLWISGLVLPFGYWSARSRSSAPKGGFTILTVVLVVGAIVYAGFAVTPRMFGLSPAGVTEWLAVLVGLIIGATIGTATIPRKTMGTHERDPSTA